VPVSCSGEGLATAAFQLLRRARLPVFDGLRTPVCALNSRYQVGVNKALPVTMAAGLPSIKQGGAGSVVRRPLKQFRFTSWSALRSGRGFIA